MTEATLLQLLIPVSQRPRSSRARRALGTQFYISNQGTLASCLHIGASFQWHASSCFIIVLVRPEDHCEKRGRGFPRLCDASKTGYRRAIAFDKSHSAAAAIRRLWGIFSNLSDVDRCDWALQGAERWVLLESPSE